MAKEEILAMKAGLDLNLLVCKVVFGNKTFGSVRPYSTDISAAWQVVERMIAQTSDFDIGSTIGGSNLDKFFCKFYDVAENRYLITATYTVTGRTIPEVICKAALLAKAKI